MDKMKVPIKQLIYLLDICDNHDDEGPPRYGWQSNKLIKAILQVREWLDEEIDKEVMNEP